MVLLLRRADLKLEDAFGLGILQRARQVVREEELAALEELRNALGGGVLTPAASISTAFRGLRSCFGLSFMAEKPSVLIYGPRKPCGAEV